MTQEDLFPWDEIPESDVLETGDYLVRGKMLSDGVSSTGKRMFESQVEVVEPAFFAGASYFENFVTGNDEAPKAIVPGVRGTKLMKRMLKAAQVPAGNSMAMLCSGFAGTTFGVSITKYTEPDKRRDGSPNEYAGEPRNRATAYWRVGEKTPMVKAATGAALGAKAPAALGGVAAGPPAGPPMGAVNASPAYASPTAPTYAPLVAPQAPSAPIAPVAPAAPRPPEQMFACTICSKNPDGTINPNAWVGPLSALSAHVVQCAAAHNISEQ